MDALGSFYGDVFRIADWNVGIFGFGKSHAARIASEWSAARQLVTDHLDLRREGDVLLAALDLARFGESDPRPRWHVIDAFVRCLREDETERIFPDRPPEMVSVELEEFIRASRWNIGYPLDAETLDARLAERIPHFRSLVQGAVERFFLVPWLETVEAKGELLRSHFGRLKPPPRA